MAYLDYMKYKDKRLISRPRPRLITFGAPRVGNNQFVKQIDGLWNDEMDVEWLTVRVVHELDLVPHLPKSIYPGQYAHSDREIWARDTDDGSMDLVLCEPSANKASRGGYQYQEDSNCSAGTNPLLWNVPDHMVYPGMRLGIPKYKSE
ncbi:hypothetical protein FB645_005087 [Coemansia sp. IMI 203386]|nr:hypothetical protein FB645_005087 [Coemansia sp. IMI 203386]